MEKKLKLNDGSYIVINSVNNSTCHIVEIHKGYIQDKKEVKSISFLLWDNYRFSAHTNEDNVNGLNFEFNSADPLYYALNRLLGNDAELTIDDDEEIELKKKYLNISRTYNGINIKFLNKKWQEDYYNSKYDVYVKKASSKANNNAIKLRLLNFFIDAETILLDDNHQVTLDEYMEDKRVINNNILKRTMKKIK
jgi:hypothetical protein